MFTLYLWACTMMPPKTPVKDQYKWKTSCHEARVDVKSFSKAYCEAEHGARLVKGMEPDYKVYAYKCVRAEKA